jgi:hypothetical protein
MNAYIPWSAEHGLRTGDVVLRELPAPGRVLAFIDDSGTPGKPMNFWASNYHLQVAVVMRSENYVTVLRRLEQPPYSELPVKEFHAKEINSPNVKSSWRNVPLAIRLETVSFLAETLRTSSLEILYMELSSEQYEATMRDKLPTEFQTLKTKEALELCFYNSLLPYLCKKFSDVALVADSIFDASRSLRIRMAADPNGIYEGGLIELDSRFAPGVQLSDFAAYLFNRRPHIHSRMVNGKCTEMDSRMMQGWNSIKHLYVNLLGVD